MLTTVILVSVIPKPLMIRNIIIGKVFFLDPSGAALKGYHKVTIRMLLEGP